MITPSFALDFTSAVLDPRVTFTRSAATATRFNASGYVETVAADTPRFDYNPLTLVCRGLLIEEARTNLLTYSEAFNTGWPTKTNATVTTPSVANPANGATSDSLVENGSFAPHQITRVITLTAVLHTYSVFAKKGIRNWVFVGATNTTGVGAYFDLENGLVGNVDAGFTASISPAANGFYRCSITFTAFAPTGWTLIFGGASANGTRSYAGSNGSEALYMYGGQLEAGAFATSYIPTEASQVTRNADVATMTGTNFTSFWNSVQGGTSTQATPSTVSGTRPLVQFDDGTANEIITLRGNTTNPELYIVDGGTPQAQLDAGTIAANTAYSLTGWWATNDCKARQDSGAVVTDTTATIPTVTQMRIGSDGANYLNGTIATIGYYDSFFGQPIYTRRKNKVFPSLL